MIYNSIWPLKKLEECCSYIARGKQPKYVEQSEIKTLNQKAIQWGSIDKKSLKYHNSEIPVAVKHFILKGDVVLNSTGTGTVGRCYYFSEEPIDKIFADSHVTIIRTNKEILLPEFLYYQLSSQQYQNLIYSSFLAGSTGQVELNKSKVQEFPIYAPEIRIQEKIVNTLNLLDKKINSNSKAIIKLENISQTLFKHWFIDFEFPNEEGKPYKSNGGDMIESELGDIPATWSIIKLSDITKILKKTFNPKKTDVENVIHFSLPAYDKNQLPTLDNVSTIKSNKWLLEDNCVVFSKMNPRTPRVWLPNLKNHLLNVASSEFVVLKNNSRESNSFIYNLCKSEAFNEYLIAHATGSTNSRQRVTPAVALDFKMALSCKMMESYGETVMGMSETIKSLHEENAYLQQIRDSLLPKLLSGEMKIPNELEV